MHTESLIRSQIPACAAIGAAAFSTAPHYLFLRPQHDLHPDRAYFHYLKKILVKIALPNMVAIVAVSDDSDSWYSEDEGGKVLGYAFWSRTWGEGEKNRMSGVIKQVWGSYGLFEKFESWARPWINWYMDLVNPDPVNDSIRRRRMEAAGPMIKAMMENELSKKPKNTGHMFLEAVAVDPNFQQRGIGRRLLSWGVERSKYENVPIMLFATRGAVPVYKKLGWVIVGEIKVEGADLGDMMMVRWPTSDPFEAIKEIAEEEMTVIEKTQEKVPAILI